MIMLNLIVINNNSMYNFAPSGILCLPLIGKKYDGDDVAVSKNIVSLITFHKTESDLSQSMK